MKLKAFIGIVVTLILFAGLVGVFNTSAVVAESIPTTEVFYGDGCWLFKRGIYTIATETNPVETYQNYTFVNAYYEMLKEHVTTEAGVEDFISILISRGLFTSGGYWMEIKSIEKINYTLVLSGNFTDAGPTLGVIAALTNPIALIPIGSLPVGEYSITLYSDKYRIDYFNRTWVYSYMGTETWTATFKVMIDRTVVFPEFPTWTSMLLTLIMLTGAIAIYKRRILKTPIH